MYKVILGDSTLDSVRGFTESFHRKNIDLYIDSGIIEEDFIIENYIRLGRKLKDVIVDLLKLRLSEEIIVKLTRDNLYYTILTHGNFRFFVYFSEDASKKERYIENIEFFRK